MLRIESDDSGVCLGRDQALVIEQGNGGNSYASIPSCVCLYHKVYTCMHTCICIVSPLISPLHAEWFKFQAFGGRSIYIYHSES